MAELLKTTAKKSCWRTLFVLPLGTPDDWSSQEIDDDYMYHKFQSSVYRNHVFRLPLIEKKKKLRTFVPMQYFSNTFILEIHTEKRQLLETLSK